MNVITSNVVLNAATAEAVLAIPVTALRVVNETEVTGGNITVSVLTTDFAKGVFDGAPAASRELLPPDTVCVITRVSGLGSMFISSLSHEHIAEQSKFTIAMFGEIKSVDFASMLADLKAGALVSNSYGDGRAVELCVFNKETDTTVSVMCASEGYEQLLQLIS